MATSALTSRAALSVNDEILDRVVRHSIFMRRYAQHEADAIVKLLDGAVYRDLVKQIRIEGHRLTADGLTRSDRLDRLNTMLAANQEQVRNGYRSSLNTLRDDLLNVGVTEAQFVKGAIVDAVPFGVDIKTPSTRMVRQLATKEPIHGRYLGEWFESLQTSHQARVSDALRIGLVEGESVDQMVSRIAGTRANKYADGIIEISRRDAATVVRTSVNHVSNAVREETYAENDDLIKGVMYVATLDNRTTIRCASLDGQVFPATEGPRPPQHHNCRSTTTPVLKSWDELGPEFAGLNELEPGKRASMDGEVSGKLTYSDWLRRQDKNPKKRWIVDDVLGPERAQLWRDHKMSLDRFIDHNGTPIPLERLRALEGLN